VPVLLAALGMLGVSLDSAVNVALPTMAASFAIGPGCCPESREAARGACHRDGSGWHCRSCRGSRWRRWRAGPSSQYGCSPRCGSDSLRLAPGEHSGPPGPFPSPWRGGRDVPAGRRPRARAASANGKVAVTQSRVTSSDRGEIPLYV